MARPLRHSAACACRCSNGRGRVGHVYANLWARVTNAPNRRPRRAVANLTDSASFSMNPESHLKKSISPHRAFVKRMAPAWPNDSDRHALPQDPQLHEKRRNGPVLPDWRTSTRTIWRRRKSARTKSPNIAARLEGARHPDDRGVYPGFPADTPKTIRRDIAIIQDGCPSTFSNSTV